MLNFPEGAVGFAFLEHHEAGLCGLLTGLGAGGRCIYILPSEGVFVELHGSINILDRNLSPGDRTGLFLVSGCKQ